MTYNCVLVRFSGEFGVKSPHTQELIDSLLRRNILNTLSASGSNELRKRLQVIARPGRYYLAPHPLADSDVVSLMAVVGRAFGISSASPCFQTPLNDVTSARTMPAKLMVAHGIYPAKKKVQFRVTHPHGAIDTKSWQSEILELCAKFAQEEAAKSSGKGRVSKKRFQVDQKWEMGHWACVREKDLEIEVFGNAAYISAERVKAPGGFPLGLEDPLVALVSGGFDSPVAAWLALRRGAPLIFLIMDPSAPSKTKADGNSVREKALEQVHVLHSYMEGLPEKPPTLVVPYGQVLDTLRTHGADAGVTCLLCKRMMYRIASEVAHMYGAKGIITGEILGEQASQTAQNLMVLDRVATMPVHRPLFGYDKEEVVRLSRQIGIYPIASITSPPCAGVPDHPTVRGEIAVVEGIEKQFNIDIVVQQCLDQMQRVEF